MWEPRGRGRRGEFAFFGLLRAGLVGRWVGCDLFAWFSGGVAREVAGLPVGLPVGFGSGLGSRLLDVRGGGGCFGVGCGVFGG